MSMMVTKEMVKAALDEHVQYMVPWLPSSGVSYDDNVQGALQAIADHINAAMHEAKIDTRASSS